ncbi:MAG: hypothetical protein QOH70_1276 [Blastocatellia bacterium]|jgi:hypothetical protein|nr:hypothetical protein [Blastocatellia bacterium]
MPFQVTQTKPKDLNAATATVLLKGLLVIVPAADGKSCDIGIHRLTDDHFLIIEIRGVVLPNKDFLVMRHAGPLNGQNFSITLDPPTSQGVFAFQESNQPFDRSQNHDDADIRWKIDLHDQGLFPNGDTLKMFPAGCEPCVQMTDGVFYAFRRVATGNLATSAPAGSTSKQLHSIAGSIGVAIDRPSDEHQIIINWNSNESPIVLPRPQDDAQTRYIISVRNEPPAPEGSRNHDELERYYDILRRRSDGTVLPSSRQFRIIRPGPFKSDEIPCMPIVLGP